MVWYWTSLCGMWEALKLHWWHRHANMTSRTRTSGHGKIECIRCHKSAFWKERRVSTLSWAAWCVGGGECTCTTVHAACTLYNVRLQQKYFVMCVPLQNRVSLSNTSLCPEDGVRRLRWRPVQYWPCPPHHHHPPPQVAAARGTSAVVQSTHRSVAPDDDNK